MPARNFVNRFLVLFALTAFISVGRLTACDDQKPNEKVNESQSEVAEKIVEVTYHLEKKNPPNLIVIATAEFPTGGFSDFRLSRAVYKKPPQDGIQDYYFTAEPPDGIAIQVITRKKAQNRWNDIPDWVRGIRVHGVGDGVVEQKFGTAPKANNTRKNSSGTKVEGTSKKGSLKEAFENAQLEVDKLISEQNGADILAEWKVLEISGIKGGIAGLNEITVTLDVVIE